MSSVRSRWTARLHVRERLLAHARAEHRHHPSAKTRAKVKLREAQVAYARRVLRRHAPKLNRTVALDGTPVFRGIALMLRDCRRHGWHGRLNSADRRRGVPERYGRLSQAALYAGWLAHKAGFLPANPPGRSTHELRSDAVAYRGPIGRPLSWWQLGLDVTDDDELVRVARRLGYSLHHPYTSGAEAHHLNLKRSPVRRLRKRRLA